VLTDLQKTSDRFPRTRAALGSRHALFWGVSLVVCLAGYADVVFGGRTFLPLGRAGGAYAEPPFVASYHGKVEPGAEIDPGAEAWQVHPWAYQERRALLAGQLPLWNRHNGLGHPLLSNGQTATFNPLHWVVLLNPDSPVLWDLHFLLLRFVAALFGTYLLHRLGVTPGLCVLGAPLGAMHGVFTVFLNRADLSAYALMPAVLYCAVRLRTEATGLAVVRLAAAVALCLAAGHPEPSVATLLTCGFFALGLALLPGSPRIAYLGRLSISGGLACALAAPVWLPLLMTIRNSWNQHPAGVGGHARPAFTLLQWLVPNAFAKGRVGLFDLPIQNFGFLGIGLSLLVLTGLAGGLLVPSVRRRVAFMAGPLLLVPLIFSERVASVLGQLPLLQRMPFELYGHFGVTYCLAIGGIAGLSFLADAIEPRRIAAVAIGFAFVVEILLLAAFAASRAPAPATLSTQWAFLACLYINLTVVFAALAWGSITDRWGSRGRALCRVLLAFGLFAELVCYRRPLSSRGNPTAPAPYVGWLQQRQHEQGAFRVMGTGFNLMPDYATAYGLDDVRLCDALFTPEYHHFVEKVFQHDLLWGWFFSADVADGFNPRSPALDWLNVRYLIGQTSSLAVGPRSSLHTQLLGAGHAAWQDKAYEIDGHALPVLYQHPDDEGTATVLVPTQHPVLAFALAQDPAVWTADGDGATYSVEVTGDAGSLRVFSRNIDPKKEPRDRHWLVGRADLSAWRGQSVHLTLRARSSDTRSDWGGWGDIHWESRAGERLPEVQTVARTPLPVVYRDEQKPDVVVFENVHAWPRVFLSGAPDQERTEEASLDRIVALLGKVGPLAVVADDFPSSEWRALCPSGACAGADKGTVSSVRYGANDLSVTTDAPSPAVLVDSDALTKGWHASIDGKEAALFRTNYLFRGVLVPGGHHLVHFWYWPREWSVAFVLALGGVTAVLALLAFDRRNRVRALTPPME
jgi:hypothetical protein